MGLIRSEACVTECFQAINALAGEPAASGRSKADEVGDAYAQQGGEQDGNDQQDGYKAHEGRGALGQLGDVLDEFGLIGGIFLYGILEGGKVVFEALEGPFLLAGVEGQGALLGLEAGNRLLKRLEIDFVHGPIGEEIGSGAHDVALE